MVRLQDERRPLADGLIEKLDPSGINPRHVAPLLLRRRIEGFATETHAAQGAPAQRREIIDPLCLCGQLQCLIHVFVVQSAPASACDSISESAASQRASIARSSAL